ncbi:meiotic nuclear division-like protein [Ceratobasidium sp. AG-Ba]|nr:meiotic nuclear division-like protein [Ceratobasidium sp. AG-Ba]
MAPRGLSADEKRVKLVEIFHETRDFYQLKELEKLGPKMKGIVSQSVKEVLQSLVDDGIVQSDKIGSSNFFWCFPSAEGSKIKSELTAAQEEIAPLESKITTLCMEIEKETASRMDTPTRRTSMTLLQAKREALSASKAELAQHGLADPALLEQKRRAVVLAYEAALRHTAQYFSNS